MEKLLLGKHIDVYPYEESKLNIYNKNTGSTYVLGEKESLVVQCLDGTNSLEDIQKKCPFYSMEELAKLLSAFEGIGLFEKKKKRFNPMKVKLRLLNPNQLLKEKSLVTTILHKGVVIGCPLLLVLGILFWGFQPLQSGDYFQNIQLQLLTMNITDILGIALLSLGCLGLHECAHMIIARYYGVNVPEMGVMLYFLIPCAYTNITGIHLLKSRREQLMVLLSGSLVNLGIVGIAGMVMAVTSSSSVETYCLALIITNLAMIFMNTMIFLKFDGYYILEIILKEPGMRENAITHIINYLKVISSRNKEAKRIFAATIQEKNALLLHVTYCCYGLLSMTYVPFVLFNTLISFF